MAVDEAIRAFCDSDISAPMSRVIGSVFDAANIAVYNAGMEPQHRKSGTGRMATTLAVCVFRHNRLVIGHVGALDRQEVPRADRGLEEVRVDRPLERHLRLSADGRRNREERREPEKRYES